MAASERREIGAGVLGVRAASKDAVSENLQARKK
jgi:hypothetical protein